MDETFLGVSFMAVSSEIYKTENKNKFLFNSFLAAKLTYTKIFVSRFLVEFLVLRVWVFVWKLAL